jgi:carbonic anhydrase
MSKGGGTMRILWIMMALMSSLWAMSPEEALEKLKEGNDRFQKDIFRSKIFSYTRKMLISEQAPFSVILTCSDSRVDPGFIFDKNLGDLFVIRLAGNIASETAMESIDYAAIMLKVPLIVVMGHQNCGAVDAVYKHTHPPKLLPKIAELISPFVDSTKNLKDAVLANAKGQAEILHKHPALQENLKNGTLEIVWAYYDFDSGHVDFFEFDED